MGFHTLFGILSFKFPLIFYIMKLKTNFDFTKYFHHISGTPHNLVIAEVANISAKDMVIIDQISFNPRPVLSAI